MKRLDPMNARLSEEEEQVLLEGGIDLNTQVTRDLVADTERKLKWFIEDSLSITDVAKEMDLSESEVIKHIQLRQLYTIETKDGVKLPRFQFHNGKWLPKFEKLGPTIRRDWHPVEVFEWFTEPCVDLYINDDVNQTVSPRDWLLMRKDYTILKTLLHQL